VGPCRGLLGVETAPLSPVVRMAPRLGALGIRTRRVPVSMDPRPAARAKKAPRLPRRVAALGMDRRRRQALGAGDRQPMPLPPPPPPRLLPRPPLGGAPQALHRCRGRGHPRLPGLRSLPPRRCAPLGLPPGGTKRRRPLHGNMGVMEQVRRPGVPRRALWPRWRHGGRQGAWARLATGRTALALGAMRRHGNPACRQLAPRALFRSHRLDTLPGRVPMRTDGDHRRHGPLRRLHRQPRLAPMRLGTGLPYAGAPPHGALAVTRGGWTAVGAARGETGLSLLPHRPLGRQLLGQRCHLGSHRVEHRQDRRLAWCKGRMHFFIGGHWKVHGMDHKLNDTDLATILQPKWLQISKTSSI
jgi:hypothetical protein